MTTTEKDRLCCIWKENRGRYAALCRGDNHGWDMVLLTAANEAQAARYRGAIEERRAAGRLPRETRFRVFADSAEGRGSGGATLRALRAVRQALPGSRILLIHSGGESRRYPACAVRGKLFAPVPERSPDGEASVLLEALLCATAGMPSVMAPGVLVLAGDVLPLFDWRRVRCMGNAEAAVLAMRESVETACRHGVFLPGRRGGFSHALQKPSVEALLAAGALDRQGKALIDTGVVFLSAALADGMAALRPVKRRLDFYRDVLPLLAESSRETAAPAALRQALSPVIARLEILSPGAFLHFGTTEENRARLTGETWYPGGVNTGRDCLLGDGAEMGEGTYLDCCLVEGACRIGRGCYLSMVPLSAAAVPDETALHAQRLRDGRYAAALYGVRDNPKEPFWRGQPLGESLWTARIHPVRQTPREAVKAALSGEKGECISLADILAKADAAWEEEWRTELAVLRIQRLAEERQALPRRLTPAIQRQLRRRAGTTEIPVAARLYACLAETGDSPEPLLAAIRRWTAEGDPVPFLSGGRFCRQQQRISLPLRIHFGGGWTDTPPYSFEKDGCVLNVPLLLEGRRPVEVTAGRLQQKQLTLICADSGEQTTIYSERELMDCSRPDDPFSLHKAVLLACGLQNPLMETLDRLGGGLWLSTSAVGVPRGSGLGTSSILAAACVMALAGLTGQALSWQQVCTLVLQAEQRMETGGGWQDQAGGLGKGLQLLRSSPGSRELRTESIVLRQETAAELNARFCLIDSGERRQARYLLQRVVRRYLMGGEAVQLLAETGALPLRMKHALQKGDVDGFAQLLDRQLTLVRRLTPEGVTGRMEQIWGVCGDLLAGRMVCGAGGGGFIQGILKEGVTKRQLAERLSSLTAEGVRLRDCRLLLENSAFSPEMFVEKGGTMW